MRARPCPCWRWLFESIMSNVDVLPSVFDVCCCQSCRNACLHEGSGWGLDPNTPPRELARRGAQDLTFEVYLSWRPRDLDYCRNSSRRIFLRGLVCICLRTNTKADINVNMTMTLITCSFSMPCSYLLITHAARCGLASLYSFWPIVVGVWLFFV